MVTDPIGDLIIQLKNAGMAGSLVVTLPYSRMKHRVTDILVSEGFVKTCEKIGEGPKALLKITLRYIGKMSAMSGVKRISRPGARLYVNHTKISSVIGGTGISILSTSKGIMTGKEAKKIGIGGEVLCEIW